MTDNEIRESWNFSKMVAIKIGSVTLSLEDVFAIDDFINRQKEEVERLEYTLLGVMHSVDKWLDGEELKLNEVSRAAAMREKTLQIIESRDAEIALLKSKFAAFKQSLIDRLRALATTKFDWNDYVDVADIVDVCDKVLAKQRETTDLEDTTDARR